MGVQVCLRSGYKKWVLDSPNIFPFLYPKYVYNYNKNNAIVEFFIFLLFCMLDNYLTYSTASFQSGRLRQKPGSSQRSRTYSVLFCPSSSRKFFHLGIVLSLPLSLFGSVRPLSFAGRACRIHYSAIPRKFLLILLCSQICLILLFAAARSR